MTHALQHHHVTLKPKAEQVEETRQLLIACARQVTLRKSQNGPSSWCASFDEARNVFYVDALFPDEAAVKFHQENIGPIVKSFAALMVAPPATVIRPVFCAA